MGSLRKIRIPYVSHVEFFFKFFKELICSGGGG